MQPWLSPSLQREQSFSLACTSRALPVADHDPEFLVQVQQLPQRLGKLYHVHMGDHSAELHCDRPRGAHNRPDNEPGKLQYWQRRAHKTLLLSG